MWTIKPAGHKKGFLEIFTKLIGNPGCSNMIGKFCFVIILRPEIPGAVPSLGLMMNFLIEPLAPLPGTGSLNLKITTRMKNFSGT